MMTDDEHAVDKDVIGRNIQKMIFKVSDSVNNFALALGINRAVVYRWISGETLPSVKTLIRIRKMYGVSIDWILTGEDTE